MGIFKVLGGAALGVVTVAALPVAGPIGTITAIGAAIAGGVGATIGGLAEIVDDRELLAEIKGEDQATARYDKKYAKLETTFEQAMKAVGISCAAYDGEITTEERKDMDGFVAGVVESDLPEHIKKKVKDIASAFKSAREEHSSALCKIGIASIIEGS